MIKVNLQAQNSKESDTEEAIFTKSEIATLTLFCKNYERLIKSRIFENGFPVITNLNICSENGVTCNISDFDHRDIYELLHVLRPFILSREPASFEKVLSTFGKKLKRQLFRTSFKQIRQLFNDGEHSFLINITMNDTNLFSDKVFSAWLNGYEYHGDKEKQSLIEKLENQYGKELVQGSIISILKGRIKAISMLNNFAKAPLEMGITV